MENEAAAWLVRWMEAGIKCRRAFDSEDDAMMWAVSLTRAERVYDLVVVPLYERTSPQESDAQ